MVNLKNITELPVAESAEGLNLIVNDNGAAKQIPAGEVGAQPDWNETDESSPAFIVNKPDVALKSDLVEEWDLDIDCVTRFIATDEDGNGEYQLEYTVKHINTFENIKSKLLNGEVIKTKAKISTQDWMRPDSPFVISCAQGDVDYIPMNFFEENPELFEIRFWSKYMTIGARLYADDTFEVFAG